MDGSVEFYNSSGKMGEVTVDVDDGWFSAVGMETGGESYIVDVASGRVYDESLEQIGSIDGELTPVEGGVYSMDGDHLSYYRFDDSRRMWSVGVEPGDSTLVVPDDQGIVVKVDGDLTRFK